jgi:YspA, cpYpsA-related SLOG family
MSTAILRSSRKYPPWTTTARSGARPRSPLAKLRQLGDAAGNPRLTTRLPNFEQVITVQQLRTIQSRSYACISAHNIFSKIENDPEAGDMRVLVCGGRDFDDAGLMISVLDRLHTEKPFTVVIHGNARGADRIVDAWAWRRGVPREPYGPPGGGMGRTRQKSWPTTQSADARRRQARSGCGVSGRRRNKRHRQARGQGGPGNTSGESGRRLVTVEAINLAADRRPGSSS